MISMGTARWNALKRVVVGFPWIVISILFLTPILIVLAAIRAAIVIPVSILIGENLFANTDQLSMWLYDTWTWNMTNLRWAITGGATQFMWLPNFTSLR